MKSNSFPLDDDSVHDGNAGSDDDSFDDSSMSEFTSPCNNGGGTNESEQTAELPARDEGLENAKAAYHRKRKRDQLSGKENIPWCNNQEESAEPPKRKRRPQNSNNWDRKWEEKYDLLKKYKEKHGHCNVPQGHKEDPPLGDWVNNQKRHFRKLLKKSEKESWSEQNKIRFEKLSKLGFSCELRKNS